MHFPSTTVTASNLSLNILLTANFKYPAAIINSQIVSHWYIHIHRHIYIYIYVCVCVCVCVSVLVPRLLGEKLRKIKLTGIDLCACEGLVCVSMCTWIVSNVCNIHSLIYTSHLSTELVYSLSKTPTYTHDSRDVMTCESQVSLSGSARHLII